MVNDETGDKALVACANGTTDEVVEILSVTEDIFLNSTFYNETKHCSKTKFGCCPDWITAAEGNNNEGCPEFILGNTMISYH